MRGGVGGRDGADGENTAVLSGLEKEKNGPRRERGAPPSNPALAIVFLLSPVDPASVASVTDAPVGGNALAVGRAGDAGLLLRKWLWEKVARLGGGARPPRPAA